MRTLKKPTLSRIICACILCLASASALNADSFLPLDDYTLSSASDAVTVAELVASEAERHHGTIQTVFTFKVIDVLRGEIPEFFEVTAPGGRFDTEGNADSRLPKLRTEEEYLLFLTVRGHHLELLNGGQGAVLFDGQDLSGLRAYCDQLPSGADLSGFGSDRRIFITSSLTTGLLQGNNNGFIRFTRPDAGVGIPVYADVSTLPAGITESQAITALQNALAAWEAVSSVKFDYRGTEIFTQSAEDYSEGDGYVIRVQMHDNFDSILDESSTLGFGGTSFSLSLGGGGTIDGSEFNPSNLGYVVLDHPKGALSDPVTLEEVLCHEIGHVIGLAHSSTTSPENDSALSESIMYFLAHADGRGASLNSRDTTTVLQSYPLNTPPVVYDRIMYAVTKPSSASLANPEVNQVNLVGFDLQGDSMSIQQESASNNNGVFSLNGDILTYEPNAFFNDATVSNLAASAYDRFEVRISDGVNLSPFLEVRIAGFRSDNRPSGNPDGIPNSWVTEFYGSSSGTTADTDTDGDGLDALSEFLLGTDPTDPNSRFAVTDYAESGSLSWTAQQFDVYEVESSSDLVQWTTERFVTQETTDATMTVEGLPTSASDSERFFRVNRID